MLPRQAYVMSEMDAAVTPIRDTRSGTRWPCGGLPRPRGSRVARSVTPCPALPCLHRTRNSNTRQAPALGEAA